MARYVITGGNLLKGKVKISGNKNAVLPAMAAALLTDEWVILRNVPLIRDVDVMVEILQNIGAKTEYGNETLKIQADNIHTSSLPQHLTSKLRGSVLLAGAMLGKKEEVTFSHPGGDVIGRRAIDQHTEGFEKLGFQVTQEDRLYKVIKTRPAEGETRIFLELPSVTGTENLILSAVLLSGHKTVIRNAAQEPHVVDLCNLLTSMGANIKGAGTNLLEIEGVEKLHGAEFTINADPIEFGTYAIAAAVTNGEIELFNCGNLDHEPVTWPFLKMGLKFAKTEDGFRVDSRELTSLSTNFPFTANFWPGFPTDLISVLIVLATQARGVSLLRDFLYESRMFFVDKLIAMGANITIADPHRVVVYGPTELTGRELETPDIRAGMALVLAALAANGQSIIHKAELIERGYPNVVETLTSLGADIHKEE